MPQIEFINVKKEYEDGISVLNDVSFSINQGEFVFLIGASGAGKSTVVKLLIREALPSEGDIRFNGESLLEVPYEDLPTLRRKVGVIFQDFKLLNSKTVFENVAIALEVVNASKEEIENVVPNVLNLVGLSDKMNKYPKQLSGGEKQRVAIARALAHEPDVLVADEATGMIDPDSSVEVVDILEKINDLGTTIIMATHDDRIVDRLKKRVIKLKLGQVVLDKKGGKYRD